MIISSDAYHPLHVPPRAASGHLFPYLLRLRHDAIKGDGSWDGVWRGAAVGRRGAVHGAAAASSVAAVEAATAAAAATSLWCLNGGRTQPRQPALSELPRAGGGQPVVPPPRPLSQRPGRLYQPPPPRPPPQRPRLRPQPPPTRGEKEALAPRASRLAWNAFADGHSKNNRRQVGIWSTCRGDSDVLGTRSPPLAFCFSGVSRNECIDLALVSLECSEIVTTPPDCVLSPARQRWSMHGMRSLVVFRTYGFDLDFYMVNFEQSECLSSEKLRVLSFGRLLSSLVDWRYLLSASPVLHARFGILHARLAYTLSSTFPLSCRLVSQPVGP